MDLTPIFRVAFALVVIANVFVLGLETKSHELEYVIRRPALLVRSIIAMLIVVPITAIALWRTLPIGPASAIALGCAALAPAVPFLPRKVGQAEGNHALATSLLFVSCLVGVVTIPLGLAVMRYAGRLDPTIVPQVSEASIVGMLTMSVLAPLLAGVAVRKLLPDVAPRLARPISRAADLVLPGLIGIVLIVGGGALFHVGWGSIAAMIVLPLVALAVGHALGGPSPKDRTALALATANRSPALAGLVASTSFPDIHALPTTLAYLIVASLISIPYVRARKRGAEEGATGAIPQREHVPAFAG